MELEAGGSLEVSEVFSDLAVIIDAALDQEEELGVGQVDLKQLWQAIKKAVLKDDVAAEGEPIHAAAAAAAAHAHPKNTWQCKIRIRGKSPHAQEECHDMVLKTGGDARALIKCHALAAKRPGGTVMKVPVKKPC